MPKQQWLSEDADLFLRFDEGGRALFWYGEDPAWRMIEDFARAGIEVELTDLNGACHGGESHGRGLWRKRNTT